MTVAAVFFFGVAIGLGIRLLKGFRAGRMAIFNRAGIDRQIQRSQSPRLFWVAVTLNGMMITVLAIAGLVAAVLVVFR
jgi:hypothetical protein